MSRILTALTLTLCLCAATPPLAQTAPAKGTVPDTAAAFEAELTRGPNGDIFAAVTRHFPAEAAALQADFAAALARAEAAGLPAPSGLAAGRALLARLAPNLLGAPDADLIAVLSDQIAMHRALADRPLDCARVVVEGANGSDLALFRAGGYDMAAGTERLYAAMARGRDLPRRQAATPDLYQALVSALGPVDRARTIVQTVERSDRADPALCGATIAVMEAMRDARFAGADVVRAEILAAVFGG